MTQKPIKATLDNSDDSVKTQKPILIQLDDIPTPTEDDAGKLLGVDEEGKYALTTVEANPTLTGTEAALTGLEVGDTKYQLRNILSYGHSKWKDFLRLYNNGNVCVFCLAGWGTNPESGAQTRIAILNHLKMSGNALIGAEFLYYRSVWPHSDSEQGDEVYIYTLHKNDTWSYEVRQAYSKVATGTNLRSTYNDNVLTLDTNAT